MPDHVIVQFQMHKRERTVDLELPLDMTARELLVALNQAYALGVAVDQMAQCYLSCEFPTALLRGNRTLREIGLRDGSIIHFTR